MDELITSFKDKIQNYLIAINKENFYNSYEGMICLIENYKEKGLTKDSVSAIITEELNMPNLDQYKEEVLFEVSNRIHGFCTSTRAIKW